MEADKDSRAHESLHVRETPNGHMRPIGVRKLGAIHDIAEMYKGAEKLNKRKDLISRFEAISEAQGTHWMELKK